MGYIRKTLYTTAILAMLSGCSLRCYDNRNEKDISDSISQMNPPEEKVMRMPEQITDVSTRSTSDEGRLVSCSEEDIGRTARHIEEFYSRTGMRTDGGTNKDIKK